MLPEMADEDENSSAFFAPDDSTSHPDHLPGAPHSERWIAGAAILLGIAADLLAFRHAPGLGLTITLLLGIAAALWLAGRSQLALASRSRLGYLGAAAALATVFSLRTSDDLLVLNAFALGLALIMASVRVTGRQLRDMRVVEFTYALVQLSATSAVLAVVLPFRVVGDLLKSDRGDHADEGSATPSFVRRHGRDIVVGCAVAVPVLTVFAVLLAESDAGFSRLLDDLFNWDLSWLVRHATSVATGAFVAAGVLIAVLASGPLDTQEERRATWAGPAVVWIVLGSTALMFTAFLALQGAYLFGGPEYLDERTGLSAAEYAVRGFYELLSVAGIVVALLLAARASFAADSPSITPYRIMAPTLALLTVVLLGSAMARLWIYADRFGLTEQRIYAAAVLVWVAAVLAWLAARIALARGLQLGVFAGSAAIAVVLMLDVANPDALVARTNLERSDDRPASAPSGASYDAAVDLPYLVTLSDDATPVLVERIAMLSTSERRLLLQRLEDRNEHPEWRSNNLSRERASEAVEDLG